MPEDPKSTPTAYPPPRPPSPWIWYMPVKCFAAGTPILCPNGARSIESIREGDRVLAYDLEEQKIVESRVIRSDAFQGDFNMLDVKVSDGNRFQVTTEHAFYNGYEWIPSNDMVAIRDARLRILTYLPIIRKI